MCLMTDPENYGALSDIKNKAFYLINKQTKKFKKYIFKFLYRGLYYQFF